MALVIFKKDCRKCGSTIPALDNNHRCYPEKNYNNQSIAMTPTHLVHAKKRGDFCSCGGNPNHRRCGERGEFPRQMRSDKRPLDFVLSGLLFITDPTCFLSLWRIARRLRLGPYWNAQHKARKFC